ncbi:hypothetical protein [Streptosporangium longisporum]|uniref:Uncharacterized protein n=1 Tax=Streptosporangium longisporum TaxID=46187 RepID=A0ABP6KT96_9ACTN
MVWHSVRESGDTKTRKSQRTPAMPKRCLDALKLHRERQDVARKAADTNWQDNGLVFASKVGSDEQILSRSLAQHPDVDPARRERPPRRVVSF